MGIIVVAANTNMTTDDQMSKATGDISHSADKPQMDHVDPGVSALDNPRPTRNCPNSDYCGPFVYTTDDQGFHDILTCQQCKRSY